MSAMDMDSLMSTINNAVAKISAIRESFEENPHYPPPRPSSSSRSSLPKTRSRPTMSRTSSFEQHGLPRPPLSRTSSTSSTTSNGSSFSSSPSLVMSRGSGKSDFDSDDGSDAVSSDRGGIVKAKASLPFPYNKLPTSLDLDALSPFKEARAMRMQDIKVAFHNGLPQEFYKAIGRFLRKIIEVKRRFQKLKPIKDCFLGSDAVGALMFYGFAIDENESILLGNVLLKLGYIEDVHGPAATILNKSDAFYRFSKALEFHDDNAALSLENDALTNAPDVDAPMETYAFSDASDEMHALISEESLAILTRVLHHVLEKKNKLLFHKGHVGCFMGAELVMALREMKIATSTIDAILVGQSMFEDQLIAPVDPHTSSFQNRYTMFRLVTTAPSV
ncbi:hypothetical protein SDRG_16698 [Saprolegnia diclina VS20]|uniref:DEP domain-containing protein n=1 Tax=Saprolegnia diclina (strain VS20) TaxID=1156394 RepID=T0R7H1_SAPDV|nr:hypothetical protein SDRG_16698 [Saprolegnia diclina VS20]EQC25432.1 hypothetical protein SDRG_16698 [Saprolegnia diclina VS20]|eukprot:XP_008621138.1 hypothetical protein SDRG_16698 [Saprolegnia diclina VS20]